MPVTGTYQFRGQLTNQFEFKTFMKQIVISMLLMAASVATSAQLKVKSNGKVCIGTPYTMESTHLTVGRLDNINDQFGATANYDLSFCDSGLFSGYVK